MLVDSHPGRGTAVAARIPLEPERSDDPLRVAIADDSMIVREGLARLLAEAGHTVVATADDGESLVREVVMHPDLDAVVVDIRMPPTQTDEGITVARRLRQQYPTLGILVLSQYLESHYATTLAHRGA